MINLLTFIGFFLFTSAGMVFIKLGGEATQHSFFPVPVIDFKLSLLSFVGFLLYGLSFLLYSSLLQKYDLSFLNPVTIGVTSMLIFICAVIFFHENITVVKIISLMFILFGVVLINLFK